MKMKISFIFFLFFILFQYSCNVDAPAMNLNPPLGIRIVNSSDTTSSGPLPDPLFNMDSTYYNQIREFISDPKYIGVGYTSPTTMTNCLIIEFYAYNTEQGFNGYNVYVISGVSYANTTEAWQSLQNYLKFYQQAHHDTTPSTPLYPVSPAKINEPYYASISSTQIAFSGGLTRFVVILNQHNPFGTSNLNTLGAGLTLWIFLTAVSLTEGSINESLPSNVITINT